MKKNNKIILIISLIIVIVLGVIIYLLISSKNKDIDAIDNVMDYSVQTNYVNAVMPQALKYLNTKTLDTKQTFEKLGLIQNDDNCTGEIIPEDGNYTVSGTCKNNNQSNTYDTNYTLIKNENLKEGFQVIEVNNGYIYIAKSNKDKELYFGFINIDGKLVWENKLENVETDLCYFPYAYEYNDIYYLALYLSGGKNGKTLNLEVDKNGKILQNQDLEISSLGPIITNYQGSFLSFANYNLVIYNNGSKIYSEHNKDALYLAYAKDKVYYLDQNKSLNIFNINTKETDNVTLEKIEDGIKTAEVIDNKYVLFYDNKIKVYKEDGSLVKEHDYSKLDLSGKIKDKDNVGAKIIISAKYKDTLIVNSMLRGYLIVDKYNKNMELLERTIYGKQAIDLGIKNRNDVIMAGNEITNIQLSEQYHTIIKTDYYGSTFKVDCNLDKDSCMGLCTSTRNVNWTYSNVSNDITLINSNNRNFYFKSKSCEKTNSDYVLATEKATGDSKRCNIDGC